MDAEIAIVRDRIAAGSATQAAFDYLLGLAEAAAFRFVPRVSGTVFSVELQRPDRRSNPFSAQTYANHINFYLRPPILKEHPGLFEAATRRFDPVPPNRRDEYRRHLHTIAEVDEILDFLREQGAWPDHRHDQRFRAERYEAITGEHLLRAARYLAGGGDPGRFGGSTAYDLLFDGQRLAPKAVFGIAASEALGFPVGPHNFTAGQDTPCFRILRAHGYPIVPKIEPSPGQDVPATDEDRTWTEGRPRLVSHLTRERGTGLAAAKRDAFRREHGRLFCERCRMDPIAAFGSDIGEACIEVHHRETQVAAMEEGHQTRLDDLECLCANCHRVTHREWKAVIVDAGTADATG